MTEPGKNQITVEIDRDLEDLVEGFLENRSQELAAIEEAVLNNDFSTINEITHNMIGSGKTYGFDFVTYYGRDMRKAAELNDASELIELLTELRELLKNVTVRFVDEDD